MSQNPFTLELWEDIKIQDSTYLGGGYWKEQKIATLSSDVMEYRGRAFDIIQNSTISGDGALNFSIYDAISCIENGEEKIEDNFLSKLIINERKVKLHYKNQWYDYIIKEIIKEHTDSGVKLNISCNSLGLEELSKQGIGLSFSLDQNNCIDTLDNFATAILADSTWNYNSDLNGTDLTEYSKSFLYKASTIASSTLSSVATCKTAPFSKEIPANSIVYVPITELDFDYSGETPVISYKTNPVQIIYSDQLSFEDSFTLSKLPTYKINTSNLQNLSTSDYYGYKVAISPETVWEKDLQRYVKQYTKIGDSTIYYGYDSSNISLNSDGTEAKTSTFTKIYQHNNDGTPKKSLVSSGTTAPSGHTENVDIYLDLKNKIVYQYHGTWKNESDYLRFNDYNSDTEAIFYLDFQTTGSTYKVKTKDNSEKIRTLIAEKSNVFNLLQSLAQVFDVWLNLSMEHQEDGTIITEKAGTSGSFYQKYHKYISFNSSLEHDIGFGFRYGINLNSISRTNSSANLTTKLIVEKIDNENIDTGVCTIDTAIDNISRDNFIINLDYFVEQGILDPFNVINDLYGTSSSDFAYLNKLRQLNIQYESISNQIYSTYGLDYQYRDAKKGIIVHESSKASLEEQKAQLVANHDKNLLTATEMKNYPQTLNQFNADIGLEQQRIDDAQTSATQKKSVIDKLEDQLITITNKKKELNKKFLNLYSRFISEGSWTGDNYLDADSYYYGALQVAIENSRPSVEYSISVTDLSNSIIISNGEKTTYDELQFSLGDKTYVIDTDFFYNNSSNTPYREPIVITAIENHIDNEISSTITVSNYKSNFESLFQRTTATVQQYELGKISYDRAGKAITEKNEINFTTLQQSLLNNSLVLSQSKDNTVITNSNGIEVASPTDFLSKVKVVAGGIYCSKDGGQTWDVGISGNGINTKMLLAGRIDTDKIFITSTGAPTFSWDKYGLNAFGYTSEVVNGKTQISSIDYTKFVRFDRFGLYQMSGIEASATETTFIPTDEDSIRNSDNLIFSLTELGLKIRSKNGTLIVDGNSDSFQVLDSSKNVMVQLGLLSNAEYGLQINKQGNIPILRTGASGTLWLKDKLYIGDIETNPDIILGYNKTTSEAESVWEVLQATKNFHIYSNGQLNAIGAIISGEIQATSGNIANIQIYQEDGVSGIKAGSFKLTSDGILTVTKGTIGGIIIEEGHLISSNNNFKLSSEGELYCSNANIQGTINATSGQIGGISITAKGIYSSDNTTFSLTNYGALSCSNVDLSGKIRATRGSIGGIIIGEDGIHSADGTTFSLSNDGTLSCSNAKLSGAIDATVGSIGGITVTDNSIYSGEEENKNWYLTKEGTAYFRNATISGKLSSLVFETGRVQSIGGMAIFRPSAKPINVSEYNLTLSQSDIQYFHVNDKIIITTTKYTSEQEQTISRIGKITSITENIITTELLVSADEIVNSITNLGQASSNSESWTIGVNSSNTDFLGILQKQAITFSQLTETGTDYNFVPRIVLGNITNILGILDSDNNLVNTYGLYADSVYLTGSLTTKITDDLVSYAGINTLNGVPFSRTPGFLAEDTSPIVFWAGSNSTKPLDIQSAKFQVSKNGTLYAQQGYFEGSIFTNATISGAVIKATKLYSAEIYPQKDNDGLVLYCAESEYTQGIIFKNQQNGSPLLSITQDGLTIRKYDFITYSGTDQQGLIFINSSLLSTHQINLFKDLDEKTVLGSINLTIDNNIAITHRDVEKIVCKNNEIDLLNSTIISGDFKVKTDNGAIEFRATNGGYDIYIS